MGNDSIIAFKTREQLRKYLGIFSPQFNNSRWKMEFLGQMLFGIQASRDALARHVAKVARKMFEVPEFFYYAIADGLRWLFVRHGKWRGWKCPQEECGDLQMEFELLTG
jgi:hypothetical protein